MFNKQKLSETKRELEDQKFMFLMETGILIMNSGNTLEENKMSHGSRLPEEQERMKIMSKKEKQKSDFTNALMLVEN